ncbi:MAG: putative addiction module antidote protein [Geminicoccaceae bacterium]
MNAVSRPFERTRHALLQDPELAALYLEEALEAGDTEAFKLAIRHVAEARPGGMAGLAREAGLNRETLYERFRSAAIPPWRRWSRLLRALGLRVAVQVAEPVPSVPKAGATG